MKYLLSLLTVVVLASCNRADLNSNVPSASQDSHAATSLSASPGLGSDCSEYGAEIYERGGKLNLPETQGYIGTLRYASVNGGGGAVFYACPGTDNSLSVPVPRGHVPDWFGELRFGFSAVFEQADLYGKMSSSLWLPSKDYYMFLYDGHYHHLGSYKIGRAHTKKSVLDFPTPLENGFATPADGILYFEIAHRSK
jgi:hypothetical protein